MRGGRGLRIATAGVRTGFAMTLTISAAPPTKNLAEFAARRRQKLRSFFTATCAWKNTSQAASVEFWRSAPKLCAEQTASLLSEKSGGFFRQYQKKAAPKDSLFEIGGNYSSMEITTPEPTVRPPSRIAKRRPFSMAMGVISSTFMSTLSPGMHISVPSGRVMTPVTSVVRK